MDVQRRFSTQEEQKNLLFSLEDPSTERQTTMKTTTTGMAGVATKNSTGKRNFATLTGSSSIPTPFGSTTKAAESPTPNKKLRMVWASSPVRMHHRSSTCPTQEEKQFWNSSTGLYRQIVSQESMDLFQGGNATTTAAENTTTSISPIQPTQSFTLTVSMRSQNERNYQQESHSTGKTGVAEIISDVHTKRTEDQSYRCNSKEREEEELASHLRNPEAAMAVEGVSAAAPAVSRTTKRTPTESSPPNLYSTFNRHSFLVDVDMPYFCLLEGIHSISTRSEHDRGILRQQENHREFHPIRPQTAHLLELPAASLVGLWVAELTHPSTTDMTRMKSSTSAELDSPSSQTSKQILALENTMISLRHHTWAGLGSLQSQQTRMSGGCGIASRIPLDHPPGITSNDESQQHLLGHAAMEALSISALHPQWTRQSQVDSERLHRSSSISSSHKEDFFIGSVSLVGFEGFTSSGELSLKARKKITLSVVQGLEPAPRMLTPAKGLSQECDDPNDSSPGSLLKVPHLLGITASSTRTRIGVSVQCDMQMDAEYVLYMARDMSLPCNPIVAIDVIFPGTSHGRSSLGGGIPPNSTVSSATKDRQGGDEYVLHELSELNLRAHTQTTARHGYDPMERLWSTAATSNDTSTKKIAFEPTPVVDGPIGPKHTTKKAMDSTLLGCDPMLDQMADRSIRHKPTCGIRLKDKDNIISMFDLPATEKLQSSRDGKKRDTNDERKRRLTLGANQGESTSKVVGVDSIPDHRPDDDPNHLSTVASFLRRQLPPRKRSYTNESNIRTTKRLCGAQEQDRCLPKGHSKEFLDTSQRIRLGQGEDTATACERKHHPLKASNRRHGTGAGHPARMQSEDRNHEGVQGRIPHCATIAPTSSVRPEKSVVSTGRSILRLRRRPKSSSLSMILFTTWSLLTWKTTVHPLTSTDAISLYHGGFRSALLPKAGFPDPPVGTLVVFKLNNSMV